MAADRSTRQRRIGILQQTDFATAKANSDAFETLSYDAGSVKPDKNVILNTMDVTSTSGLIAKESRAYKDAVSGLKSIAFSAPATRSTLALHFAAALQSVTSEGALTPYQKIMTPAYDSSIVDFTSGGYLFGIATDNITTSDGEILDSAVLDTLSLSIDFNAEGQAKLAQISGTWVGNNIQPTLNLSGTWVAQDLSNFYNDTAAFSLSASGITTLSDHCKKKYTLTINNNIAVDCRSNSKPANYKFSPSIQTVISLPYDSTTYAMADDYAGGTQGTITLSTGSDDTAGHLKIVSYGRISADPRGTDGDYESMELTIDHQVDTSAGKSLEVTIADVQDRGW